MRAVEHPNVIEIPPDPYDEFHATKVLIASRDERFNVRRANEADFEAVYDCVDAAFGKVRPRAMYEWMYRRNPYGRARLWLLEERSSGKILKTGGSFAWPVWHDTQPLTGGLSGDAATLPEWQRKGLSHIRREVSRSHTFRDQCCTFSGPNESSRIVSSKANESADLLGYLTGGVLVLDGQAFLASKAGMPAWASVPIGWAATQASQLWQKVAFSLPETNFGFKETTKFNKEIDALTLAGMHFKGFWSPHAAEFLNWRYLEHPVEDYRAYVLCDGDTPIGYSVVRFDANNAALAEFVVNPDYHSADRVLLAHTIKTVKEAGCASLHFFATPIWRHWRLFRQAGMLPFKTKNFLEATYVPDPESVRNINNWQLTPGDRDYH